MKRQISKIRRKNAKIYPIYKMFSWDLLFFYSIEFLFCIITKKITVSGVLIVNGIYILSTIIMQIPAVAITDFLGKRKSIIIGNILILLDLIILIILPGVMSIITSNLIYALGYGIKKIAETNLLYDSVSTRGGEGLYSKIDDKGSSWYYILDGIASLISGYLFVINNYLPIFVCMGFVIISIILSFQFQDIYKVEPKNRRGFKDTLKQYNNDLKSTTKVILKSKRMKAFILFQIVFFSLTAIIDTYKNDLLINIGIAEEQFSMIFAVLTLIGGVSISLKHNIEKKFKNRTLAFISLAYIASCLIIGTISLKNTGNVIIPIILIMLTVQKIATSIWYILELKYLKSFTKQETRNKITFTYSFIGSIAATIFSILGGILLKYLPIQQAILIVGLIALAAMTLTLDYMRTRFGLKPDEYSKQDIDF